MRVTDLSEIRSLDLFLGMQAENFERLMQSAYVQNFPPQIELITEGERSDFLHIVVSGAVELFATWNRNETTMAVVRPISSFILAATIRDAPYLMSARTLTKSRVILLPSNDVREVFAIDNSFARAVVKELALCYRSAVKGTKNLKLRSSVERLANYILRQRAKEGHVDKFELKIEKRKLASYLGMTPENLSRAINTLAPYGVEINGATVIIHDIDDLTAFAKPTAIIDDYRV